MHFPEWILHKTVHVMHAVNYLPFLNLINNNNNLLLIRRKYLYEYIECQQPLGMENGAIADGQITASSFYNYYHTPQAGRLRYKHLSQPRIAGWVAYHGDLNPWLQIDLGRQYNVTRVAT